MDAMNRQKAIEYLLAGDFKGLLAEGGNGKGLLRFLISLTYDKSQLVCWRAIEAVGMLSAGMKQSKALDAIDRLFTMMRDESGGNPWSAPEMIGEIIRHNPEAFSDLVPVLVSFRDERMFAPGILRALALLALVSPELVMPYRELAFLCLHSEDAALRANALLVMKNLRDDTYAPSIAALAGDGAAVDYYDGGRLSKKTVGELAREALEALGPARG
ncbi:MAG: hypothetical protein M0Z75_04540 [Nitrospiraceae bacterium]|nr:hypothetical protein [Nitrospiraceae bacterium]